MLDLDNSYHNRRSDRRIPCLRKTFYVDGEGKRHRTEILNTSQGGAKLTTDKKVRVGDRFQLLEEERNGKSEGSFVEVRWLAPLPGNLRLVVGVMNLED